MRPFEPTNVSNAIRKQKRIRFSIKINYKLFKSIDCPPCIYLYIFMLIVMENINLAILQLPELSAIQTQVYYY